jgi:hypothetical protein
MRLAGDSEFSVRFLSVCFGVLLVPLVYRLGAALFSARDEDTQEGQFSGLVAAALVVVSPFLVYYSQEARNYIVVTLWSALATFALWRACAPPGRRWWLVYTIAAALTVYSHYYGVFILVFHFVYLVVTWRRNLAAFRAWVLSGVGVAILFTPWLLGFWGQFTNLWLNPDYWPGTIDFVTVAARTFATFALGSSRSLGVAAPVLVALGMVFVAGLGALLFRGGFKDRRGELYAVLYALVPLLAVYAITASNPKFAERYLIIISPAFYLLLGRALVAVYGLSVRLSTGRSWIKTAGGTLCVVGTFAALGLSGTAAVDIFYGQEWIKDDHRGAIRYIEEHSQPGDKVILVRDTYQTFSYYYQGELAWEGFHPSGDGNVDVGHVANELNRMIAGHERVWLLLWQEHVVDPTKVASGLLRKYCRTVPVGGEFAGLELLLFEVPPDVKIAVQPEQGLAVEYENGVRMQGFDLSAARVAAGEKVTVSFYWQATRPVEREFSINLGLLDRRGLTWAAFAQPPSGHYRPSVRWEVERRVRGEGEITVPAGNAPRPLHARTKRPR